MSRTSHIVLIVLLASVANADADRVSIPRCDNLRDVVLPEPNSVDVPLNARLFRFRAGWMNREGTTLTISAPGELNPGLQPNTVYRVANTNFMTGLGYDLTPPGVQRVRIELSTSHATDDEAAATSIQLSGRLTQDVAFLQVEIADPKGRFELTAPRSGLSMCQTGIELAPGNVRVTYRAFDIGGNASPPHTITTYVHLVDRDQVEATVAVEPHEAEPVPRSVLFVFALILLGLPLCTVAMHAARRRMRRATPEPVSLLLAEDALRIVRRGHLVFGVVAGLMTAGAVTLITEGAVDFEWPLFLAPAIALVVFCAQLIADHAALRHLARDGATAERRGSWLIVGGARGDLELRLSASVFESARNASVPAASAGARRND